MQFVFTTWQMFELLGHTEMEQTPLLTTPGDWKKLQF
jgi:hypothetical protein